MVTAVLKTEQKFFASARIGAGSLSPPPKKAPGYIRNFPPPNPVLRLVEKHPDATLDSPLTGPSLAPFYPVWRTI